MITEIIWFFTWPVLILVSYLAVGAFMKKFEKSN